MLPVLASISVTPVSLVVRFEVNGLPCAAVSREGQWLVTVADAVVGRSSDLAKAIESATGGIVAAADAARIADAITARHVDEREVAGEAPPDVVRSRPRALNR